MARPEKISLMEADAFGRLDAKLDLILERLDRLEDAIGTPKARSSGRRANLRPLTDDPELAQRLRERLDYRRSKKGSDELEGYVARLDAEHPRDPDWWLRHMLDRMDQDDPIPRASG